MPLKPTKRYRENGILIREYEVEKESLARATPSLYIGFLPEIPFSRAATPSEDFLREGIFKRIPIIADYYVDKKVIWVTTPPRFGRQVIFICGDPVAAQHNLVVLLQKLVKQYKLRDRDIKFLFQFDDYENTIRSLIKKEYVKEEKPIEFEIEKFVPTVNIEFLQNNQWNAVAAQQIPITKIKISSNDGTIHYRVHVANSNWSAWVINNTPCGGGIIDGFQYKYEGNLQLYHRCVFSNGGTTKWTTKMPPAPYKKQIVNIEFELK